MGWKVFIWIMLSVYTLIFSEALVKDINQGNDVDSSFIGITVLVAATWLWMTLRTITSLVKGTETSDFASFILKNIIAPVIVSLIIYSITGQIGITLISVPIVGVVSASLGV